MRWRTTGCRSSSLTGKSRLLFNLFCFVLSCSRNHPSQKSHYESLSLVKTAELPGVVQEKMSVVKAEEVQRKGDAREVLEVATQT